MATSLKSLRRISLLVPPVLCTVARYGTSPSRLQCHWVRDQESVPLTQGSHINRYRPLQTNSATSPTHVDHRSSSPGPCVLCRMSRVVSVVGDLNNRGLPLVITAPTLRLHAVVRSPIAVPTPLALPHSSPGDPTPLRDM